jgi:hypothetical protein
LPCAIIELAQFAGPYQREINEVLRLVECEASCFGSASGLETHAGRKAMSPRQWSTCNYALQVESKDCGESKGSSRQRFGWKPVVAQFATTPTLGTVAEHATVGPSAAESATRRNLGLDVTVERQIDEAATVKDSITIRIEGKLDDRSSSTTSTSSK